MAALPQRWSAWVLVPALAACASESSAPACVSVQAAPLYFGTEDPGDLEIAPEQRAAIGMVAPDPPLAVCTGVLVLPGWVLTAGHCGVFDTLTFRPSLASAEPMLAVSTVLHPSLDLMLLELDPAHAAELDPVPLTSRALDRGWVGRNVTLAGVGETESGTVGALRYAVQPVVSVSEYELTVDGMGRSGACTGDSGGPLLVAEHGGVRVAGVLDRGSDSCLGTDVYLRADRIRGWVAEATGTACVGEP